MALVLPAGQAYPAAHAPLHPAVVRAGVAPYRPAMHCPVQAAVVRPALAPYWPGAQSVQLEEPAMANLATMHNTGGNTHLSMCTCVSECVC